MSDLLVRGGTVIDGTGGPGRTLDVRVRDGRIAEVGARLESDGEPAIDAGGAIVAPGFIDTHTHLDPSLFWEPAAATMSVHGVTSILTGNCSLSLVPLRARDRAALSDVFSYIEDMPIEAFTEGVPWTWETYGQYRAAMRASSFGVNVAALVGHTPLRMWAMGEAAWERAATPDELAEEVRILQDCIELGAFGLSTSLFDKDRAGRPVPSAVADDIELGALFDVLAANNRIVEFIPDFLGGDLMGDIEGYARLCGPRGLTATWNTLASMSGDPALAHQMLEQAARQQNEGCRMYPQVSPRRVDLQINWDTSIMFMHLPTWNRFVQSRGAEKVSLLADADWRASARAEWDATEVEVFTHRHLDSVQLGDVGKSENKEWVGRTFGELHAARGGHPSDLLADWLLENDLKVALLSSIANVDEAEVATLLCAATTLVSASDAGAHQQMFCATGDTTLLLTRYVRDRADISIEQAVHELTGRQAGIFGFKDRGEIAVGKHADLTVFDLDELEYRSPTAIADVPGGAWRYARPSGGYRFTIVSGAITQEQGKPSGELPGSLLDAG
jgi:N-acyl-D-amino-acid deacylase